MSDVEEEPTSLDRPHVLESLADYLYDGIEFEAAWRP